MTSHGLVGPARIGVCVCVLKFDEFPENSRVHDIRLTAQFKSQSQRLLSKLDHTNIYKYMICQTKSHHAATYIGLALMENAALLLL